jgi:hypothetical protein
LQAESRLKIERDSPTKKADFVCNHQSLIQAFFSYNIECTMQKTKYCPTCKLEKTICEFGKDKARGDGLQSQCRLCKRAVQARWYQKNKAQHVTRVTKRRREVEADTVKAVLVYLESHPCVDCGEGNPIVLEFDHIRGRKLNSICNLISRGCCWKTIYMEIQKCEVRCCNCHRIKTAKQFGYRKMLMTSAS